MLLKPRQTNEFAFDRDDRGPCRQVQVRRQARPDIQMAFQMSGSLADP